MLSSFLTRRFGHFCWIGIAKFIIQTLGYTLLVDYLDFSGFTASLLFIPTFTILNWLAIEYFIVGQFLHPTPLEK